MLENSRYVRFNQDPNAGTAMSSLHFNHRVSQNIFWIIINAYVKTEKLDPGRAGAADMLGSSNYRR